MRIVGVTQLQLIGAIRLKWMATSVFEERVRRNPHRGNQSRVHSNDVFHGSQLAGLISALREDGGPTGKKYEGAGTVGSCALFFVVP